MGCAEPTYSRYANNRCRCVGCTDAWRVYRADYRAKNPGQEVEAVSRNLQRRAKAAAATRRWRKKQDGPEFRAKRVEEVRRWRQKRDGRRYRLYKHCGYERGDYDRMFQAQDGKCAICGRTDKPLVVEHCHVAEQIRGLTCNDCNTGIGFFRDNPEILSAAIQYLKAPPGIPEEQCP